jgi:hypothetical protein
MKKRIIKNEGNTITKILNPNTLRYDYDSFPSKFNFKDGMITTHTLESNQISDNIKKYMTTPSVIISYNSLLDIYDIKIIDDLLTFIKNSIKENKNYYFINRILNTWIRANFNDLRKSNKILITIYNTLFDAFFKNLTNYLNKDTENFIIYWFDKNNIENFNLNLGEDLKKYLIKKYEL